MWGKKKSPEPAPAKPEPPKAHELQGRLLDAILKSDTEAARKVFDLAFWEKVEFRPDPYHLLQAAQKGDRKMVTLLTSYGATWTTEEAKLARIIIKPDKWQSVEGPLKNAGIRTQFTNDELKNHDLMTAVLWAHRSVSEAKARGQSNALEYAKQLDTVISAALIQAVLGGKIGTAKDILLYRDPRKGDGRSENPLDISAEFNTLLRMDVTGMGALAFTEALAKGGLVLKPVELREMEAFVSPDVLPTLEKRGLLAKNQQTARLDLLGLLTMMQDELTAPDETLEQRRAQLRQAAQILFDKQKPATAEEAEAFVRLHAARSTEMPVGVAFADRTLLDIGFFDSPAWTAARLRALAASAPPQDKTLAEAFNHKAARQDISQNVFDKLLNDQKFSVIEEAHRTGAWQANAAETVKIIDYLSTQVKKDLVPENVVRAVKTLFSGGADFSLVNPVKYLGKAAPALAKTLLDSGAVAADNFDLEAIARKNGGDLKLITLPGQKGYEYTEFLTQLILEIAEPHKYLPLREASVPPNYQKLFIKEWVENLSRRPGGSISFKRRHNGGTNSSGPR